MKKVLILVVSCEAPPYGKMIETSLSTWDSIQIEGVETVFYCGQSTKEDTEKVIYLPVKDSLMSMGEKTIQAFEWALKNKSFDYIARVNSSCYVNKKKLIKHVQGKPDTGLYCGVQAESYGIPYLWGGCQYIISKDIAQLVVDNCKQWDHTKIEDVSIAKLLTELGIAFDGSGNAAAIHLEEKDNLCLVYGQGESMRFTDYKDLNKYENQYFFRVKQDGKRHLEEGIMNELFKALE